MKKSLFAVATLAVVLSSCGGKTENADARALLVEATDAFQLTDYDNAMLLLDSLKNAYPTEVAIQREAMALRPKVIEQNALLKIAQIDSLTQCDQRTMESLKPKMKWVKAPEMIEGYWTDAATYNANFMNTTGLEPRVSEIGQFYIVSSANPSSLKHTSVTLTLGNRSVTTADVPYDGDSNYRIGSGEIITFTPEQSDTIGAFAAEVLSAAKPGNMSVTFNGSKGKKTIKLSEKQADAIRQTYLYSMAVIRARDNQVERERLQRTIEIAQRQTEQAEQALQK